MKRGHIPHRTCLGCRDARPKPELLRLVMGKDGSVTIDGTHHSPGRGMYMCYANECVQRAFRKGVFKGQSDREILMRNIGLVVRTFCTEQKQRD